MIEEEDYDSSGSDSCPSADGFDEKDFKHLLIRALAPKKKKTTPIQVVKQEPSERKPMALKNALFEIDDHKLRTPELALVKKEP